MTIDDKIRLRVRKKRLRKLLGLLVWFAGNDLISKTLIWSLLVDNQRQRVDDDDDGWKSYSIPARGGRWQKAATKRWRKASLLQHRMKLYILTISFTFQRYRIQELQEDAVRKNSSLAPQLCSSALLLLTTPILVMSPTRSFNERPRSEKVDLAI